MDKLLKKLNNILGKILLTKSTFFGIDKNKITIIVGDALKIYLILSKPKKLKDSFPFKENKELNLEELKKWTTDNDYELSFSTLNMSLKRRLSKIFGCVMIEHKGNKMKDVHIEVMDELKKSGLPVTIKEWAKNNPEKFIKNIEHIKTLLNK